MARRSYQLAAVTAVLTFALILLGEFTAVSGSGATCGLQWPDCSGQFLPFGLPVNDFIEQFHRSVAMVVGFFILGTGAAAYRNFDARDIKLAGVLAIFLLPLQVILGGTTVTFSGLVPGGYQPLTQAVHHLAAMAILGTVTYTALRMRDAAGIGLGRVRTAVLAALAVLPFEVAFSRGTIFTVYGSWIQIIHHTFELALFTAAFTAFVWSLRRNATRSAAATGGVALLSTAQVLLGVGLFPFGPTIQLAYYALAVVIAALLVATARIRAHAPPTAATA